MTRHSLYPGPTTLYSKTLRPLCVIIIMLLLTGVNTPLSALQSHAHETRAGSAAIRDAFPLSSPDGKDSQPVRPGYGSLPLSFEKNNGGPAWLSS